MRQTISHEMFMLELINGTFFTRIKKLISYFHFKKLFYFKTPILAYNEFSK